MGGKRRTTATPTTKNPPEHIDKDNFYGMKLDDEQYEFAEAIWSKDKDIVFVDAKAGTGKTTIAVGVANLLVQYGRYPEIIYIMSPYGERKQGYLPGDMEQKSSVYFEPCYQALVTCNVNHYTAMTSDIENQKNGSAYITCTTDTFLRGQNLDNAVIIIDEAQNYTTSQLKKTLTRVGSNTKVIVIGHKLQCDLEDSIQSGFGRYIEHFREEERASVCTLKQNHRGWISRHADDLRG